MATWWAYSLPNDPSPSIQKGHTHTHTHKSCSPRPSPLLALVALVSPLHTHTHTHTHTLNFLQSISISHSLTSTHFCTHIFTHIPLVLISLLQLSLLFSDVVCKFIPFVFSQFLTHPYTHTHADLLLFPLRFALPDTSTR